MTYEYDALEATLDPRLDMMLTYERSDLGSEESAVVAREAIKPVCSPAFAEANKVVLERPVSDWIGLPFLQLTKQNKGWATRQDWFEKAGTPKSDPRFLRFDNYVYLFEAAAAGRGLALGWRGLIERHLGVGALVPLADDFVRFDRALYAELTRRGRGQAAARKCLSLFQEPAETPG